jgi:hypothetical protein
MNFQNLITQNITQTAGNLQLYADKITCLFADRQC